MSVIIHLLQEGIEDMVLELKEDILDIPIGHFSPNSTIRIEIVKEKK